MAMDPKQQLTIGGAAAAVIILALLVWAVSASSRASKAEARLAELGKTVADDADAAKEQKHLLDIADATAKSRTAERDAYDAERKDLRRQLDDAVRLGKKNADLATDAEKQYQAELIKAQQAEEARATVVKDRDHQYQQWRGTQDRYDDLLKSYQQLKQQVADGGAGAGASSK